MAERPAFREQLQKQWNQGKFLCVGLDPDLDKLPVSFARGIDIKDPTKGFMARQNLFDGFLKPIIDATADIVAAYKPNIAFYEGDHGKMLAFENTMNYLHSRYPDIPVILDSKRADIGNTNGKYNEMFDRWPCDAMTTNPYFGGDTFGPLQGPENRSLIVLCKTSNPGSKELQDMPINIKTAAHDGLITNEEMWELLDIQTNGHLQGVGILETTAKVYEMVAYFTARRWNSSGELSLVVGATHPEAFEPVRKLIGNMPILIPAIGTQGGDLEATLKHAPDSNNQGIIINSGSAILYASSGEDFAEAARAAAIAQDKAIREGLGIA